jgi:hypothetical protein
VIRFFRPNRAGQSTLDPDQLSQYKLSDNLLYVNSSLTRPYFETKRRKLQEKDWLVGFSPKRKKGTFSRLGDFRSEDKDVGLQKQGL